MDETGEHMRCSNQAGVQDAGSGVSKNYKNTLTWADTGSRHSVWLCSQKLSLSSRTGKIISTGQSTC
jgi:hypothetical protein